MDRLLFTTLEQTGDPLTDYFRIASWAWAPWAGGGQLWPPFANPGSWDNAHVSHPFVVPHGSGHRIFYTGNDGTSDRIGAGSSNDLATGWIHHGVVVDLSPPSTWDDTHVNAPTAILDPDTWHLWYAGFDGSTWRVGYTTAACAP